MVPYDPGREHERCTGTDGEQRSEAAVREPEPDHQPHAEHEWKQSQPRIAEDGQAEDGSQRRRPPERAPAFGSDQRDEDERRRQEPVEDLAVQVNVVPDEVRMQRRE